MSFILSGKNNSPKKKKQKVPIQKFNYAKHVCILEFHVDVVKKI